MAEVVDRRLTMCRSHFRALPQNTTQILYSTPQSRSVRASCPKVQRNGFELSKHAVIKPRHSSFQLID